MVRRTKDDSLLQIIDIPCKDIAKNKKNFKYDKELSNQVTCTTSGTCRAVYGVEQVIQIETRPLWLSDDMSASLRDVNLAGKATEGLLNTSSVIITEVPDVNSAKIEVTESTPLRSIQQ